MTSARRLRSRLARVLLVWVSATVLASCGTTSSDDSGARSGAGTSGAGTLSLLPVLHPTMPTATAIPAAAHSGDTAPPMSACAGGACVAGASTSVPNGYVIRVWSMSGPAGRPIVELLTGGRSVEWMLLPRGEGGAAKVTCASAPPIGNCVVVSRLGIHAAIGEMVLVADRHLLDTGAFAIALTPQISVTDLDGDGYLDLAARDSDYRPNFAAGHLFDHTYRYDHAAGRFVSTGCSILLDDPAATPGPRGLEHHPCPTP